MKKAINDFLLAAWLFLMLMSSAIKIALNCLDQNCMCMMYLCGPLLVSCPLQEQVKYYDNFVFVFFSKRGKRKQMVQWVTNSYH